MSGGRFYPSLVFGDNPIASFTYTNWQGETRKRTAEFRSIYWGTSPFHVFPGSSVPQPQWLADAIDVETGEDRCFALKDMTDLRW